jgi:hypothetical protein
MLGNDHWEVGFHGQFQTIRIEHKNFNSISSISRIIFD